MENKKNTQHESILLHQRPINSGFNAWTTATDVIEGIGLSGKTIVITGGYSGIGLETTKVLSSVGAQIVVPARDMTKATSALKGIKNTEVDYMDLFDPASIDAFAARFLSSGRSLHVLINNAGIMASPLKRDIRGYESQFATNHLGHFQLTARLWEGLSAADGARVICLSSWGHRLSPVNFEDLNFDRRDYDPWSAYAQSKTANILFAMELDRIGQNANIRGYSLHPGGIAASNLNRSLSDETIQALGLKDEKGTLIIDPSRGLKTIEQGAATTVWCATSPQLIGKGGVYCENCDISPVIEQGSDTMAGSSSMPVGVASYAIDTESAKRLWDLSEKMTGIEFRV